jgi:hypothetical protein
MQNADYAQNVAASAETAPSRPTPSPNKSILWTGRVLSALPALMMVLSAAMKISHAPQFVTVWTGKLGYAESQLLPIGLLELTCVAFFVFPRTAVLGAILLTGYLGGAVATHVRVGDMFLIPVVLGVLAWTGVYLRDERLRALVPLR